MTENGLSIEMLPARHGDGLWVEWGTPDDVHRMIIDGGTKSAFVHIRDKLDAIPAGSRKIDLLVVSHIDLDHIEAPIELIRTAALDIAFGDIWFNEEKHLVAGGAVADGGEQPQGTDRGGIQGEFLGALIARHSLPWNQQFGGGPIVVQPSGPLPVIELDGGLRLVLLSPTPRKLEELEPVWNKEVARKDLSPGDRARAIELLEERMGPVQPTRGDKKWGSDHSAANGSSIAFIAEYGGERWLLSGDAHVDVLVSSLKRYAKQFELAGKVPLDGFKIPHHGSVNNMSDELLELVDVKKFLVSSNGAYFKHPDARCIEKIIEKAPHAELAFNYRTDFTVEWADRPGVTYQYDKKHRPLDPAAATGGDSRNADPAPTAASTTVGAAPPVEPPPLPGPGPAPTPVTAVEVRVYHGSLDRADSPVIVGHYAATPLSGAEGHIDRRFDGRLSDRHTRDLYPGPTGSFLFVEAPARSYPAHGVLVVGLGDYGELTPRSLAETLRTTLIAHALTRADTEASEPVELAISSVLVGGTGEQGMGVRSATRAIVDGLVAANQSLLEKNGRARCQYTRLDLWEQRAPEAELALVSLRPRPSDEEETMVVDPNALPEGVTVDPDLRRAAGFLMHSLSESGSERPWRRIVVTEPRVDGQEPDEQRLDLQFMVDRRLAAVGQDRHPVEKRPLRRMLAQSVNESELSDSLNAALFELLLPDELKWEMRSAADIQLVVDEATATIPWEMLAARSFRRDAREPLALRAPLTRQLAGGELKRVDRAEDMRALVIGNPPAGPAWPSLPGAVSEARAVIDTLDESGVDGIVDFVFDEHNAEAAARIARIEAEIFGGYRIVHIAGHGAFDAEDPTRSGVVIGPDEYLSAQFLSRLRPVPDLVFLNCCHLGRMDDSLVNAANGKFNELGASVARVLIDSGVRAVVAAGWAVDDFAATAFATTFYDQMLRSGATFGEAVFAARQAAHTAAPRSNTWGAYQCYGDSGLRLPAKPTAEWLAPEPATVREVLRRIEFVIDRVESRGSASLSVDAKTKHEDELKILTHTANRQRWFDGPDGGMLAESLGRVHSEMGNWQVAIDWYEQAIEHPSGSASLHSVEQLANIRDRYASSLMRNPRATERDQRLAARLAEDAADGLKLLTKLDASSERSALFGGHFKRQAVAAPTKARRISNLKRSADRYAEAYATEVAEAEARSKESGKTEEPAAYTLLNYVQLETIRARLAGRPPSRVTAEEFDEVNRLARTRLATSEADFWGMVGAADADLTRRLVGKTIARGIDRLASAYGDAFASRSTARHRASSIDHLKDLAALHDGEAEAGALRRLVALLDPPVEALRAAADERADDAASGPRRNAPDAAARRAAEQRALVDYVQLESLRSIVAGDATRVTPDELSAITALAEGNPGADADAADADGTDGEAAAPPVVPAMTVAQAELARRLARSTVRRRFEPLRSRFTDACADGATDRELAAEIEHLRSLAEIHPENAESRAIGRLVDAVVAASAG
ncbi:MAG: CHAT domain-containing protein [Ilumatobacteraceae bacterium]